MKQLSRLPDAARNWRAWLILAGLMALILFPRFATSYQISLLTEVLIFAIFAMSLDLLLGYTGLASFGHAAFFGLGGYLLGFMARSWTNNMLVTLPVVLVGAGLAALIIGFFALRTSGLSFLMFTLATAQMLFGIAIKWTPVTGGSDGLSGVPRPVIGFGETVYKFGAGAVERVADARAGLQHVALQDGRFRAGGRVCGSGRFPVRALQPPCLPGGAVLAGVRAGDDHGHHRRRGQPGRPGAGRGAGAAVEQLCQRPHRTLAYRDGVGVHPVRAVCAERHYRPGAAPAIRGEAAMSRIKAERLRKNYGGLAALADVTLEAEPGERRVIIGPNGAGKTTLFKLIAGELAPTAGRVYFDGRDITHLPVHARANLGLSHTFQRNNLFFDLSVFENVRLAVQHH
ncbi:MAG: ATP-binding cassette domain-containing protein, partial [Chloroflexi bacterium]|nr:ATP-binding cassette domain-containing protein [Chloroflexota bacterium]